MLNLIHDYQLCRTQLQKRIHELNRMLRDESIKPDERENLKARRDMLKTECSEMLRTINEMQKHLKGVECLETDSYQHYRLSALPAERHHSRTVHQPETA